MSEPLFESSRFRVVRRQRTDPRGQSIERDVILHPGAVVILPELENDQVVLIRNYRIALEAPLIELPAGTLEPGEDPRESAGRELAEETGYLAQQLEALITFYSSPGILHEKMHLFLATGLQPGPTALEPGEEIEPLIVPWSRALEMARDGEIQDAKTLCGLLWYDAFRRRT